jgi:hypothetical protein
MKHVYAAMLATCLGTLVASTVQAQSRDTAYGTGALVSNTSGSADSAFGYDALYSNSSGSDNTATGNFALYTNTTGPDNTATGNSALYSNISGNGNTATGSGALLYNRTGNGNTGTGDDTLSANTLGSDNTATGITALASNFTGDGNTADGDQALYNDLSGNYNIALGHRAGFNIAGSSNITIGNEGTASDKGVIRIGTEKTQTTFYAAGISGVQIGGGIAVYVNGNGQLGTVNSSIRFKEDVHDMAEASSRLFQLRPVTYRYKQADADGSRPIDYGLIAEEVVEVYPDMVARDSTGEILTVQYQKLTPMLLNEVQKQQRQLAAQQGTIQTLERRLSTLEATMKAGRSQK